MRLTPVRVGGLTCSNRDERRPGPPQTVIASAKHMEGSNQFDIHDRLETVGGNTQSRSNKVSRRAGYDNVDWAEPFNRLLKGCIDCSEVAHIGSDACCIRSTVLKRPHSRV